MSSVLHLLTSPAAAAVRALPLLADAAIKGVLVFGAAGVAVMLCRRRSAATRHAIWAGAVVAQLALPTLSALLPSWRVPLAERLARAFDGPVVEMIVPAHTDVMIPGAAFQEDAMADDADASEAVAVADMTEDSDAAPTIAAAGRAASRIARAEARTARAEARMARAEARAEARAARRVAIAVGPSRGGTFVVGRVEPSRLATIVRFVRDANLRSWLRVAGVVWLLGALAILGRFVAGTVAVSRLARRSERVDDGRWLSLTQRIAMRLGVGRPMTLLRSGRFAIPVTWGVVYPVVLLPDDADDWTEERRRYVLVHEMAHVKRVDAFTQLVAQLTLAVFWFNPLVWIAAHRMRVEREHACDDYVLREGTPASTYAADLLDMVRSLGIRGPTAQPAFAALAMARPDELETRMQAILDPVQDRRSLSSKSTLGLALSLLALLLPLAAFKPFSSRLSGNTSDGWGDSFAVGFAAPAEAVMMPPMPEMAPIPPMPEVLPMPEMPAMPANLAANLESVRVGLEATRAPLAALAAHAATLSSDMATMGTRVGATPIAATTAQRIESCSSVSLRRSGTSTSIHSSSDDDDSSFQYISSSNGRCLQVAVWGKVEFSADERDVSRLSRDGRLYVRERRADVDRELTVTPGDGDAPRYAYSVDGERASFEEDGRAWLGSLLPEAIRESGINARQRVARLRREGGLEAVLADISHTQSTSAKRAAYEALLRDGNLSSEDEAHLARQAGADLASSDGELRAVLEAVGKRGHQAPAMAEALGAAVEHMSSDGEKRAVLEQYALQGDRDMLLMTMRQARNISSDGEKAAFLRSTVSRYLANSDEALRNSFFSVTQTISSDGEKREVLMQTLPFGAQPGVLMSVLDVGRQISSDGEKSELLVNILRRRFTMTPQLREAFMRTTRSLGSDGEYRRVMEAMQDG